jgi:long-chain acyl-CoA synthetase
MAQALRAERPWPAVSMAEAQARLTAPGSPFEMEERELFGIRQRVWKNAPPTLRAAFLAGRQHGEKEFLVFEDHRVTYEGFARAAIALSHALIAEGVAPGDRVALAMRNLPEWPVAFFAGILAGAVVVPLNAWWLGAELEYGLNDSGATLAIVDGERLARIAPHLDACPALRRVLVCRKGVELADPRLAELESLIGPPESWRGLDDRPLPDRPRAPDDDATILYTSGTTGRPKGAIGTHRNATSTIMAVAFNAARALVRRGDPLPAPNAPAPQRVVLLSVPFFHTTGCHSVCIPALVLGMKLVLMRRWNPKVALQLIEQEKVTNCGGVPTVAYQLLESEDRPNYDLSSLETVSYGGAPAGSELAQRIATAWPRSQAGLGWGMTETSSIFTQNLAEDYTLRPDSSGVAEPVCDMRIVDEEGRNLPPGGIGELWCKGPNVVRGYWNKPEATAETFVDGWLKTGDIARIDDEGFLFILDRKKDMLIRGGENIYCIEVEDALYQHPEVMDAAVIGRPHPTLGEEPIAIVTLRPGATVAPEALRTLVAGQLAAFKVPVEVFVQSETLPRNANGKIMKSELKKVFV